MNWSFKRAIGCDTNVHVSIDYQSPLHVEDKRQGETQIVYSLPDDLVRTEPSFVPSFVVFLSVAQRGGGPLVINLWYSIFAGPRPLNMKRVLYCKRAMFFVRQRMNDVTSNNRM